MSDYVEGGATVVVDVVRASVRARLHRDMRGRVLSGSGVKLTGKPKGSRSVWGLQARGRLGMG
ncbi:hypothetical protein GCM10025762_32610 [Haloechinothrix salitolerans]